MVVIGIGKAKSHGYGLIRVLQDRKGEVLFLDPCLGRFRAPVVDPEYQDILALEIGVVVTVPVTVTGSIAAAGGREKPEPDLAAFQVGQLEFLARVVRRREIRRRVALFEHRGGLLMEYRNGQVIGPGQPVEPASSVQPRGAEVIALIILAPVYPSTNAKTTQAMWRS